MSTDRRVYLQNQKLQDITDITVKPKIIIICGQTAAGKTSFAIELAEYFCGEIISADSMQIYKYMDIGTAKPTPTEQKRIKHHLIDIIKPDQDFDAALYAKTALKKINELKTKKCLCFVVGGSGLYIKSLIHGLFGIDKEETNVKDINLRKKLKKQAEEYGNRFLHEKLQKIDPETANFIHPNDRYRIIRSLEFFELTKTPISQSRKEHSFSLQQFDILRIGIGIEREKLYQRINKRVDVMIESGFEKEVLGLLNSGYSPELKSMKSIGYRNMVQYINSNISWDKTIAMIKQDTRRYAKRQMTWFRADSAINWIKPGDIKKASELISVFST